MALRSQGALLWISVLGLAAVTGAAATRILQTDVATGIDPRRYRCGDARSPGRAPTEDERRLALAHGVRLPWAGANTSPRQSVKRGNGVVRNGNELNNVMVGTPGDDFFRGAEGDDRMMGGAGRDIYVFGLGDGYDTIEDTGGPNVLQFLASVDIDALTAEPNRFGGLVVRYGPHETVTIERYAFSGEWFVESSCGGDSLPLAAVIARHPRS
jgi:hypothetical protein